MTKWYQWCDIHEDPKQIKSLEAARDGKCTPVSIDKEKNTGGAEPDRYRSAPGQGPGLRRHRYQAKSRRRAVHSA